MEHLNQQLTTAHNTIKQLKEKLESNCATRKQLDQHVQRLNSQINELLGKLKVSNIRHSESEEKLVALQSTISTLEHVSF